MPPQQVRRSRRMSGRRRRHLIRRFLYLHPALFSPVHDLGLVPRGCPAASGSPGSYSSVWLPAWLPGRTAAQVPQRFQDRAHPARWRACELGQHKCSLAGHRPSSPGIPCEARASPRRPDAAHCPWSSPRPGTSRARGTCSSPWCPTVTATLREPVQPCPARDCEPVSL